MSRRRKHNSGKQAIRNIPDSNKNLSLLLKKVDLNLKASHALEVAKVLQHAYEVFEDEEKVKRWVSKANRALNRKKPVELFDTLTGINIVDNLLGRIEEGIYS